MQDRGAERAHREHRRALHHRYDPPHQRRGQEGGPGRGAGGGAHCRRRGRHRRAAEGRRASDLLRLRDLRAAGGAGRGGVSAHLFHGPGHGRGPHRRGI